MNCESSISGSVKNKKADQKYFNEFQHMLKMLKYGINLTCHI